MIRHDKDFGFTLAEVLITLGIIGVVAALTIPAMITKYKHQETAARLKHAYSVIGQALTAAQSQNGDIATWGVGGINGADTSSINWADAVNDFAKNYFIPNVKISSDFGIVNATSFGYDDSFRLPASGSESPSGVYGYWISLANGTLLMINIGDACVERDPNDNSCIRREYRNMIFKVDVNGVNKPNTIGKDVFLMTLDLKNNKFTMHNYGMSTRDRYINYCKTDTDAQVCGYLIMMDGWEIKNDYPWR